MVKNGEKKLKNAKIWKLGLLEWILGVEYNLNIKSPEIFESCSQYLSVLYFD